MDVIEAGLWNHDRRIAGPIVARPGANWTLPPGRSIPIYFEGQESITNRLSSMYPPHLGEDFFDRRFTTDLTLKAKCRILGFERTFEETTAVQVDVRSSQFTGL